MSSWMAARWPSSRNSSRDEDGCRSSFDTVRFRSVEDELGCFRSREEDDGWRVSSLVLDAALV